MTRIQQQLAMLAIIFFCTVPQGAMAHFGMLIPDHSIIDQKQSTAVLTLSFSHPFAGIGMDMKRPEKFTVTVHDKTIDLLQTLQPATVMDHKSWRTSYTFKRPGVYQFALTPTPYWEAAEDLSIIHYSKVIIPAFGDDEGWDKAIGLPTEIVPLLRPFGNYAGNSFSGRLLLRGKPVPRAEVEVEFYNKDGALKAVDDYHVTQLIKTDTNGVFTFTCPWPGWWGFAALSEADYTIKDPSGKDKGVEIGAVLWIYLDKQPGADKR